MDLVRRLSGHLLLWVVYNIYSPNLIRSDLGHYKRRSVGVEGGLLAQLPTMKDENQYHKM